MRHTRSFSLIFALIFTVGCGERADRWDRPADVRGPLTAGERLIWIDVAAEQLTSVGPGVEPRHVALVERPRAFATAGDNVLIVGGPGAAPQLEIVPAAGGAPRQIDLLGAYDRIEVSPDLRRAVLLFDPLAAVAKGAPAARNNNEVTVVDLVASTATVAALATESLAPRDVVFSSTNLAAIVLDAAVVLIDLSNPRDRLRIPLKLAGGSRLTPRRVLFSPDAAFLYVMAEGISDVLSIEINRSSGLDASINFLFVTGAGTLRDILVSDAPGFSRYVAAVYTNGVRGDGVAALLDATGDTSRAIVTTLSSPATQIDTLGGGMLLLHGAPGQQSGGGNSYVAGWDPLADRLDEDALTGPAIAPVQITQSAAFFEHPTGSGLAITRVLLERLDARLRVRLEPVTVSGQLTAPAASAGAAMVTAVSVLREDSGAAPLFGEDESFGTTGALIVLGVNGTVEGITLDAEIQATGLLGRHLYALHTHPLGDVTFVPIDDLLRKSAERRTGFLFGGLLDLEGDQ